MNAPDESSEAPLDVESHVLAVHVGHASNCSSVGSVVDFLFVSAAAGAALLAAVAATLGSSTRPEAGEPEAATADDGAKDERAD